jgi:hypothetical protein
MAPTERASPVRRKSRKPRRQNVAQLAERFYGRSLDAAERVELQEAADVHGLDEEIAVLRLRLRQAVDGHPDDLQLMLRGIDMLVKAVSAKYKMSRPAAEDLADSIAAVVRGVGVQLMPERFADD